MGWVDDLIGKTVGVDTSPLIFYIEEHPVYGPLMDPFFEAVEQGEIRIVTSMVTLLEVLVHPIARGDEALAQKYNDILLTSPHIETATITAVTAQTAAELRAVYRLKTPDALQLATCVTRHAGVFLTNDRDFPDLAGVEILKLRDLVK